MCDSGLRLGQLLIRLSWIEQHCILTSDPTHLKNRTAILRLLRAPLHSMSSIDSRLGNIVDAASEYDSRWQARLQPSPEQAIMLGHYGSKKYHHGPTVAALACSHALSQLANALALEREFENTIASYLMRDHEYVGKYIEAGKLIDALLRPPEVWMHIIKENPCVPQPGAKCNTGNPGPWNCDIREGSLAPSQMWHQQLANLDVGVARDVLSMSLPDTEEDKHDLCERLVGFMQLTLRQLYSTAEEREHISSPDLEPVSVTYSELPGARSERIKKQPLKRFPRVHGLAWDQVSMRVVSSTSIRIRAGKYVQLVDFSDLGLSDNRKNNEPDIQWKFLCKLALRNGELGPGGGFIKGAKKIVQKLRESLKAYMQIQSDPFRSFRKVRGYHTVFALSSDLKGPDRVEGT